MKYGYNEYDPPIENYFLLHWTKLAEEFSVANSTLTSLKKNEPNILGVSVNHGEYVYLPQRKKDNATERKMISWMRCSTSGTSNYDEKNIDVSSVTSHR